MSVRFLFVALVALSPVVSVCTVANETEYTRMP
jgi:hypothetical protein